MLFPIVFIFFLISKVHSGELLIAKCPPSLKFQGNASIEQHLVPEILSTALGFTTQQVLHWDGVTITSPFTFAKALIVLHIDGVSSLENSENLKKYTLINDENEYTTWKRLRDKIIDRYPMTNSSLMELSSKSPENITTNINYEFLKSFDKEYNKFLNEINNLNNIISKIRKSEKIVDFQWFSLKSLNKLSHQKGPHHSTTVEAKKKVYKSILELSEIYSSIYDDQVLVVALTNDASHTRKTRNVNNKDIFDSDRFNNNLYNPDFPVIFNIILWFTVAFIFALIAVSVFIASMDPGRDSIIYRMTSNRMKKDS